MIRPLSLVLGTALLAAAASAADEPVDLEMASRIRDEGFARSQVMDTLFQLTDVSGPRLTGSPQLARASAWARDRMKSWGLADSHLEPWGPFGRGWTMERVSVHLVKPDTTPLLAYPKAWTPGTNGPVLASLVHAKLDAESDFPAWKGKLAGKIVLVGDAREEKGADKPFLTRYADQQLADLALFDPAARHGIDRQKWVPLLRLIAARNAFLASEKAAVVIEPSRTDEGVFTSYGGRFDKPEDPVVPMLAMQLEHYDRLARLVDAGQDVEVEVDVRSRFHDGDLMSANVIAEIPGRGPRPEVVMLGAHLDSWHAGTGATDNAAGCAVVMEAMRILKALDAHPLRTIRVALWTGEEQGLLGSHAYVSQHFGGRLSATNPEDADLPLMLRREQGPLTLKPEQERLSAYFNVDNGAGRIRGIYTEGNVAAAPLFAAWFRPLADLGVTTVTNRPTGGTDHASFDEVGLPGFQFVQDDLDYETRTHHTQLDVYDRVPPADVTQAAVVVATVAYQAAMRDARFPRKALPGPLPVASPKAPADAGKPGN